MIQSNLFTLLREITTKQIEPKTTIARTFGQITAQMLPARNRVCRQETKYRGGRAYVSILIGNGMLVMSNIKPDRMNAGRKETIKAACEATN
jgi:hypothetical protein